MRDGGLRTAACSWQLPWWTCVEVRPWCTSCWRTFRVRTKTPMSGRRLRYGQPSCLSVCVLTVSFSLLWIVFLPHFFAQGSWWSACFPWRLIFHKSIIISSDTGEGSLPLQSSLNLNNKLCQYFDSSWLLVGTRMQTEANFHPNLLPKRFCCHTTSTYSKRTGPPICLPEGAFITRNLRNWRPVLAALAVAGISMFLR